MIDDRYVSLKQLVEVFSGQVNEATIRRWTKGDGYRGVVLKSVKIGAQQFFRKDWVDEFIEECQKIQHANEKVR